MNNIDKLLNHLLLHKLFLDKLYTKYNLIIAFRFTLKFYNKNFIP